MARDAVRTVGSVELVDGEFVVKAKPHVRMVAKRLFGRSRGKHGDLVFRASDDACRDLQWFSLRYPLDFSRAAHRFMHKGKRAYEKRTETAARILLGDYESQEGWEDMALPPRPYQEQAAALCKETRVLLVVDELGLGKTVTGLAMLRDKATLPCIVVAPPHLCSQWAKQCKKFLPQYSVEVCKRSSVYDIETWPDIFIISYFMLSGWADFLESKATTVIFDEVQELRRRESAKYKAARHVAGSATYVMGLSATPIYNYGGEIFNVYDAMCPGILGGWEEFKREWCYGSYGDRDRVRLEDPEVFGEYLRDAGWMVRRTRLEVGRELPPHSRVTQIVDSDSETMKAARGSALELARLIVDQNTDREIRFQAAGQLDSRIRHATGVAKAPYVAAFADMLLESSPDPLVMFGWHRDVYGIWESLLKKHKPVMFTGSESRSKKDKAVEAFVNGDTRLMFMSLRSGAGVDGLQFRCSRYVIGELDWSPGVLEQIGGRFDRDGQDQPVFGYYPVCNTGSDPIMVDTLGLKRAQIEPLRDPGGPALKLKEVDPNHIRKLAEDLIRQSR